MPLRDHFRPPLDNMRHWEGFHAGWPMIIVASLRRRLPRRYFAEPRVHSGSAVEVDVATFEHEAEEALSPGNGNGESGVATAVWAPPRPTLTVATDLPLQDVDEVRVFERNAIASWWPPSKASALPTRTAQSIAGCSRPSVPLYCNSAYPSSSSIR
jgi:hypothetical protein